MFEVDGAQDSEVKAVDIDRKIGRISMQVSPDNSIDGMRFVDDEGNTIAEISSPNADSSHWVNSQIDFQGKQIIGLKTNTETSDISSLAFVLIDIDN